MKKFVVAAGFLTSLVLASNTYADAFSAVDYLKGSYDISSDCGLLKLAKCEESKIEAFLGGDYGGVKQIQTEDGAGWLSNPNNANIVSFDLSAFGFQSPIAYFAIKIGGGNSDAGFDLFVFKNNPDTKYAVVNLGLLSKDSGRTYTADSISHIATVPEPASLLLMGVGVLTATAMRRRRQGQVISRA